MAIRESSLLDVIRHTRAPCVGFDHILAKDGPLKFTESASRFSSPRWVASG